MQEGVKKNANLVIKLRATFLKVCSPSCNGNYNYNNNSKTNIMLYYIIYNIIIIIL